MRSKMILGGPISDQSVSVYNEEEMEKHNLCIWTSFWKYESMKENLPCGYTK